MTSRARVPEQPRPTRDPQSKARRWRAPLILFGLVLLAYAATIGREPSLDVWTAHLASWKIATTGVPWLDVSTVPALDEHPLRQVWVIGTADGRESIGRAPGVIAASLPAYWLWGGADLSMVPAGLTAAVLTAGAVTLLFLALRDRIGDRQAALAAIVFGLTTPVWSVAADGLWPHTLTVLGIAGMAWAAQRERWWLVGLFGGIALWGRLHAAVICAVLGVALAVYRRSPTIAIRAGISSGALLALMSGWTRWMYGDWDPTSAYRVGEFTSQASSKTLDIANHLGFWVSADRGLLVWTPLLLVLAMPLVRNWRELPDWSRALVYGGGVYTLLQGSLNRFSGGDAFYGYRLGLELLACLAPALALSAHRMGPIARRLFMPVAILQFAMIFPGAAANVFFVNADDVWTHNSVVVAFVDQPLIFGTVFVASILAGVLFARIWANPGLERSGSGTTRSSASQ